MLDIIGRHAENTIEADWITGRDSSAFLPLRETGKNQGSNQFLNWLQQYATGILRLNHSSPYSNA